mgnify:CR=1 FL=1
MINFFKKIIDWFRYRNMFVIADATDNSITFSRDLARHMRLMHLHEAKVFAFYIPSKLQYAFILNPEFDQETQLADVQYNSKYKSVGFEMLNPTVNRMFYDYQLPHGIKVKLSVKPRPLGNNFYYAILRPSHSQAKQETSVGGVNVVQASACKLKL